MRGIFWSVLLAWLFVSACSDDGIFESYDSSYDRGHDDGHASGYNTTCKIRTTMISGDWDKKGYSEGYNAGYAAGSRECKSGIRY